MKLIIISTYVTLTCIIDGTDATRIQEPIEPVLLTPETQQWEKAVSLATYAKKFEAQMLLIQDSLIVMNKNEQPILRKEVKVPVDPDVRKIIYRRARDGL